MIEKICNKLTKKIQKKMPEVDDERAEVINYGLQLVIGEIPKIFIIVVIAFIARIQKLTLISCLAVIPYRTFSRRSTFKNAYWMYYYYISILLRKCVVK